MRHETHEHLVPRPDPPLHRGLGRDDQRCCFTQARAHVNFCLVVQQQANHGDVAVGNAIGSNLFNILGIMGATAIVAPIPVTDKVLNFDLWIMLLCAVLVIPFALRDKPIGRITGAFFLIAYSMYLSAQFHGMSGVQAMALAG